MTDDEQEPRHVRCERLTREHYGLAGDGRPLDDRLAVGWCGDVATNLWVFQSADHVLHALLGSTGIQPCLRCLEAMRTLLDAELD